MLATHADRTTRRTRALTAAVLSIALLAPFAASAGTVSVISAFGASPDGNGPVGGLIQDATGALFGVTASGGTAGFGTVFKLTPPVAPATTWTRTTLYNFLGGTTDGANPGAGLVLKAGALYGTTTQGGPANAGVVFKLTPPAKGKTLWTYSLLYAFGGTTDGLQPSAPMVFDTSGALVGTTAQGGSFNLGALFKLAPPVAPATTWKQSVLYSFTGALEGALPAGGVVIKAGTYYGTTSVGGTALGGSVYKLTSLFGTLLPTTLYNFSNATPTNDGTYPASGVVFDKAGALYGATLQGGPTNNGTVFKLTPPPKGQTAWTESVLYAFTGDVDGGTPAGSVTVDASGNVFGATASGGSQPGLAGNGVIYKLAPSVVAGKTVYTQSVVATLPRDNLTGRRPAANVTLDISGNGNMYVNATGGGPLGGGAVLLVTP